MPRYKQLTVWRKAHENFIQLLPFVDTLPQRRAVWEVVRQLLRAAGSIGANIAEGHGRQTTRSRQKDYVNFLEIALGSANETDYWLTVIQDAGWVTGNQLVSYIARNEEVIRMLCVLVRETERIRL